MPCQGICERDALCSAPPEATLRVPVLLASLPFAEHKTPSLGLSMLQGGLREAGIGSDVVYFTLSMARAIGTGLYSYIATGRPTTRALLGEWIFAADLSTSDNREVNEAQYLAQVLSATLEERIALGEEILPRDEFWARLVELRRSVGDHLDSWATQLLERNPSIVGLTSVCQQHVASLCLARRLKLARPELPVILGGANCEGLMGLETVRQFPFVDAIVSGEADLMFPDLVRRLLESEDISEIPGVITKLNLDRIAAYPRVPNVPSPQNLDRLPRPIFESFRVQFAQSAPPGDQPRITFETSRGCWWGQRHHCTFCGISADTMPYRSKSAGRALAEIDDIAREFPGVAVAAVDNILDMKYFRTFLPALAERQLKLELFYEVKANLTRQQLRQLRLAGVTTVQPGIESLSDATLKIMRKGTTPTQNLELIKGCLEEGIWPYWNLLYGFPGEQPCDYDKTAELLPLLSHLPPPSGLQRIRLDRFSPNYEQAAELGFTHVRPLLAYSLVYDLPTDALENLAYFFDYDYLDGREPETYVHRVEEAVRTWRRAHADSALWHWDNGDRLWIVDTRPVATHPLSVLGPAARLVYLHCERARAQGRIAAQIHETFGIGLPEHEVLSLLERLARRKLVATVGDQILALSATAPEPIASRMQRELVRDPLSLPREARLSSRRDRSVAAHLSRNMHGNGLANPQTARMLPIIAAPGLCVESEKSS